MLCPLGDPKYRAFKSMHKMNTYPLRITIHMIVTSVDWDMYRISTWRNMPRDVMFDETTNHI